MGLYNWYAVNDARNIAPEGWHVATAAEWDTLADYLGGSSIAGGKMKEVGTVHWTTPNTGATNESNFTALPGGSRDHGTGSFNNLATNGYWWTSTPGVAITDAYGRGVSYNDVSVIGGLSNRPRGFSVRCIKD